MKTKIFLLIALLIGSTIMVFANHDNGRHKGWERDGHPNAYGSPRPHQHP